MKECVFADLNMCGGDWTIIPSLFWDLLRLFKLCLHAHVCGMLLFLSALPLEAGEHQQWRSCFQKSISDVSTCDWNPKGARSRYIDSK